MSTIGEKAQEHETSQTLNISDLDVVSVDVEILEKTFKQGEPEEFTISVINVDGKDYRVPTSVLSQLKEIMAVKKDLKFFQVLKSGNGMQTKYTVLPKG